MNRPHLLAGLLSSLLSAVALLGFVLYGHFLERRFSYALATEAFPQKNHGIALQRQQARQPDLMPLYGSSDLDGYEGPSHPTEIFRTYPTGFTVSPVGHKGATALSVLENLAAVGSDLRGKKVAVPVMMGWLIGDDATNEDYYGGNFSRLHAGELAFSTELSFALKQAAASRMLDYPRTVEGDPLLRFALERLADGSPLSWGLYYASLPLGKLQNLVLRIQDHWEMVTYIRQRPGLSPEMPHVAGRPDWGSMMVQAEAEARERASNNPLGLYNEYWERRTERLERMLQRRTVRSDAPFIQAVQQGTGWSDFELLLRTLKELDAQPLIISAPLKGIYYDYAGVSADARSVYYQRVREVAELHNVTLLDFSPFDGDIYFVTDPYSHPSPKAWAHYAQALDAFYHDALH